MSLPPSAEVVPSSMREITQTAQIDSKFMIVYATNTASTATTATTITTTTILGLLPVLLLLVRLTCINIHVFTIIIIVVTSSLSTSSSIGAYINVAINSFFLNAQV